MKNFRSFPFSFVFDKANFNFTGESFPEPPLCVAVRTGRLEVGGEVLKTAFSKGAESFPDTHPVEKNQQSQGGQGAAMLTL